MNKALKKILIASNLILLCWTSISCAESAAPLDSHESQKAAPMQDLNVKSMEVKENTRTHKPQPFNTFFKEFLELVKNDRYESIAKMTKFPFVFKGQLDIEGSLEVNKEEFLKLFPKFIALETDVEFDGEGYTMPTKLSILTTPEKPKISEDGSARLHDFVFNQVNGQWLFSLAYTRLDDLIENQ